MGPSETPSTHKSRPGWRGGDAERTLALLLRTFHLMAVVALGAALLGAPLARGACGAAVLASGLALGIQELLARRIVWRQLAGAVVMLKLLAVAWAAWAPAHALAVFWGLLVLSSLSSHAPKRWRHWSLPSR